MGSQKKYIEQKTKQELIEIIERAHTVLSSNFDLHSVVDDIYQIMVSPQTEGDMLNEVYELTKFSKDCVRVLEILEEATTQSKEERKEKLLKDHEEYEKKVAEQKAERNESLN